MSETNTLGPDAARRFADALAASAGLWCAKQVRATLHATTPVAEALALDMALKAVWAEQCEEIPARQFVWTSGGRGVAPLTCELTALDAGGRELLRRTYSSGGGEVLEAA